MRRLSTTLQLAISAFPMSLGCRDASIMDLSYFMPSKATKTSGNTLSQKGKRKRNRQMIGRGIK